MTKFVRKSKEERMYEIRTAALDIFINKGYTASTMDEIIDSLELSKGTVYRYYPSKTSILTDLLIDGIEIRDELFLAGIGEIDDNFEALADVLSESFFSDVASSKHAKLYVIFLYEKMFDSKLDEVYKDIFSYNSKMKKYVELIGYEKAMKLVVTVNTLMLGKFILADEFISIMTKNSIKKMVLNIIKQ